MTTAASEIVAAVLASWKCGFQQQIVLHAGGLRYEVWPAWALSGSAGQVQAP
jgi:hypothetical protein